MKDDDAEGGGRTRLRRGFGVTGAEGGGRRGKRKRGGSRRGVTPKC
jgi:hypothetical protein